MLNRRNKPLMLNSLELYMLKAALESWQEPEHMKEEKAALLNALSALEYIDTRDKESEHRASISELFDGYDGEYTPVDVDWGESVGTEVLEKQECRRSAWGFAEGLSKVDDLETSEEFKELREREVRGEITTEEMRQALVAKYEAASKRLMEQNQEAYMELARGEEKK